MILPNSGSAATFAIHRMLNTWYILAIAFWMMTVQSYSLEDKRNIFSLDIWPSEHMKRKRPNFLFMLIFEDALDSLTTVFVFTKFECFPVMSGQNG